MDESCGLCVGGGGEVATFHHGGMVSLKLHIRSSSSDLMMIAVSYLKGKFHIHQKQAHRMGPYRTVSAVSEHKTKYVLNVYPCPKQ